MYIKAFKVTVGIQIMVNNPIFVIGKVSVITCSLKANTARWFPGSCTHDLSISVTLHSSAIDECRIDHE